MTMINWHAEPGLFWFNICGKRVVRIKDVRRAKIVLFSDRYVAWHIGPFAIQTFFWKPRPHPNAAGANVRAERLMRWRAPDAT